MDPREAIETAEGLMRSRFAAFRDGDADWLLRSWHPSTRPTRLDLAGGPTWRALQVVDTVAGGPEDTHGIVEFRASCLVDGEAGVMQERSAFVREGGRWLYVDAVRSAPGSTATSTQPRAPLTASRRSTGIGTAESGEPAAG